jgi:hypothetical protein
MWFRLATLLLLTACTGHEKLPELYLLLGKCEVSVKTDDRKSDIYVDGIMIGHGVAKTKVPCGEKKIQVESVGKKIIEEYQTVTSRLALELDYKLQKTHHVENWALEPEFIEQLAKGQGPMDVKDPETKKILAENAKMRDEVGYNYSSEELVAIAKKASATDDAEGGSGGDIKIDPATNFDDPKTWI